MTWEEIKKWLEANTENADLKKYLAGQSTVTPEGFKAFLETEEGKKILQPLTDKAVSKGIESWKTNNLSKIEEDLKQKINPDKTDAEKEADKLRSDFDALKTQLDQEGLKNFVLSEAQKRKIPTELASLLVGKDKETTQANLDLAQKSFGEEALKAIGRTPGGEPSTPPSGTKTFTQEQLNDPGFVEKNYDDIAKALKDGTIK